MATPPAPYHRIDIRLTSRHLVARAGGRVVADATKPLVLYESGALAAVLEVAS